jgi:hypothetical protein
MTEELEPGVLSVSGAARRANLPEHTIWQQVATGRLPSQKRWGRRVILAEDLDRFISTRGSRR